MSTISTCEHIYIYIICTVWAYIFLKLWVARRRHQPETVHCVELRDLAKDLASKKHLGFRPQMGWTKETTRGASPAEHGLVVATTSWSRLVGGVDELHKDA